MGWLRAGLVAAVTVLAIAPTASAEDGDGGGGDAAAAEAAAKADAQKLVTEGVALLKKKAYVDALAKFEAAYARFPSPKILLNIGTTLRDMGRLAEAANVYQRYMADPATTADRVGEVKQILNDLDRQLVLLTIEVTPSGTDVSIDDGPWTSTAGALVTRVMPGKHVLRGRKAGLDPAEVEIEGKAGEKRTATVALKVSEVVGNPGGTAVTTGGGTQTGSGAGTAEGTAAGTRTEVAVLPPEEEEGDPFLPPVDEDPGVQERRHLPGVVVQARIDGKLRGAAVAIGVVYAPVEIVELELTALLSNAYGAYLGARYRFLPTKIRPLVAGGVPVFFDDGARFGFRIAAGGELVLDARFSVIAELGFEHFFNPNVGIEANVLVPIIGVHGHL